MEIIPCHETIGSINTKLNEYLRSIKLDCYSFVPYREYMGKLETVGCKGKHSYFKASFFLWDMREVCKAAKQLTGCSTNP